MIGGEFCRGWSLESSKVSGHPLGSWLGINGLSVSEGPPAQGLTIFILDPPSEAMPSGCVGASGVSDISQARL